MEIQNTDSRPDTIKKAVNLFWVSIPIRYIEMLASFFMFNNDLLLSEFSKLFSVSTIVIFHLARLAICTHLLFKILKGDSWARNALLAITIIDLLSTIVVMPTVSSRSIFLAAISIAQIGLQSCALFLLFMPSTTSTFFKTEFFSDLKRRTPQLEGTPAFLFYLLSLSVSYIGIVNLGKTGLFFSIPFLYHLGMTSFDKRYGLPSRLFLTIFLSLYILKHSQTTVFYPAIGRELYLTKDSCLEEHQLEHKTVVRMSHLTKGEECDIPSREDIIKVFKMNKGSKLIVSGTKVETEVFMNEKYFLLAETPLGQLEYQVPYNAGYPREQVFAKWSNGKDIIQDDMYRNVFHSPSQALWLILKPFLFFIDTVRITEKDK